MSEREHPDWPSAIAVVISGLFVLFVAGVLLWELRLSLLDAGISIASACLWTTAAVALVSALAWAVRRWS